MAGSILLRQYFFNMYIYKHGDSIWVPIPSSTCYSGSRQRIEKSNGFILCAKSLPIKIVFAMKLCLEGALVGLVLALKGKN